MKTKPENTKPLKHREIIRWVFKAVKLLFKTAGVLLTLIIAIIGVCLFLLWLEHRSALILPAPTGTFAVSRTSYDWVDSSRVDSLARVTGQKRELMVWIWYPAKVGKSSKPSEYMPAELQKAIKKNEGFLFSTFFSHDESKVHDHSIANGDVSPGETPYPVVIMRSGIGALATDYSTLAEDLASHGYIVVGADAPYTTSVVVFPDGRVINKTANGNPGEQAPSGQQTRLLNNLIKIWSADTRFILNKLQYLNNEDPSGKFKGRLNLQSVGIFGHSFGGATAAQFCHDDNRCKAGIDVDGQPFGTVISEGLHQPFLFMLSDHSGEEGSNDVRSKIHSIYDRLPANDRLWISISGTRHFNFSDQALLKDSHIAKLAGALGSIDERRGLAVTAACIQTFFDVSLKNVPKMFLKKRVQRYSEIKFKFSPDK